MSDLQPIADRVEIDALHGESADATSGREYDRLAPLSHGTVSRGYSPTTSSSSAARRSATGSGGSEGSLGTTWCKQPDGRARRSFLLPHIPDGRCHLHLARPRLRRVAASVASRCLRPPVTIKSAPISDALRRLSRQCGKPAANESNTSKGTDMNCYDHGTQGEVLAAVATCVNCGAGMCAAHSRVDDHTLVRWGWVHPSTRKLLCVSCDRVLAPRSVKVPADQRPAIVA
jgi:hypothetical protein